jgi:hypothetical protein
MVALNHHRLKIKLGILMKKLIMENEGYCAACSALFKGGQCPG